MNNPPVPASEREANARADKLESDTAKNKAETKKVAMEEVTQLVGALKVNALEGIQTETGKALAGNFAMEALLNARLDLEGGRNPNMGPLQTQLQSLIDKNNVDRAMTRFPSSTTTATTYDLSIIDSAVYGTVGTTELAAELRPKAQEEARKRVGSMILQNWNPRNTNIQDTINGLGTNPNKSDSMLVNTLRTLASEKEKTEFENIKNQFESGAINDADFRRSFEGGANATIRNPSLRTSLEKYYNDSAQVEARKVNKDTQDKTRINTSARQFGNLLARGGAGDEEGIDIEAVIDNVTNSPGFGDLPAPVRESVINHYESKGRRLEIQRDVDEAKMNETESKNQLEIYNERRANFSLLISRLRWIGLGLVIGGVGGGAVGLLGGSILGGAAGGIALGIVGVGSLGNYFDKSVIVNRAKADEAHRKYLEGTDGIEKILDERGTREVDAMTAITKMSAIVNASVTDIDKAKLIDQYLKTAGLKDINELLSL
jgi:hypothetical protein